MKGCIAIAYCEEINKNKRKCLFSVMTVVVQMLCIDMYSFK